MLYLVYLFMETHLLTLLQDNCLELFCCAFLRKLSACVRNIHNSILSTPTDAILADTDILVKPKYSPIYRSVSNNK